VLLKNQAVAGKPLLPIDPQSVKKIVLAGPYADVAQFGGYSKAGTVSPSISPLAGLSARAGRSGISVSKLQWSSAATDIPADDQAAIRSADLVVAVIGLDPGMENEGHDRSTISLPTDQEHYVESILALNPRAVVVLEGGSAIAAPAIYRSAPATIDAWYPGEEGGAAIADVLFGDYDPSGRLPLTFYASDSQLRPMTEYDLTKGRTYMYLAQAPAYAFGYGLSYTSFKYSRLKLSKKAVGNADQFAVSVDVMNTGDYDGDEVVQGYVHAETAPVVMPTKQLWAFQRVSIPKGKTVRVTLTMATKNFGYWDTDRHAFRVDPGKYDIMVGPSSDSIRQTGVLVVHSSGSK
jgi:beta-glucosidase